MAGELTQEQVMAQLKTRGFESGFGTPLRDFRARLTAIAGSMVQRGQMKEPKLEVVYKFSELDVIESTEPYPLPTAEIAIMHSNRDKSNAGILGRSIDKIINAGMDENAPQDKVRNQSYLIGKMQHWKMTPGHMMWDNDKKMETPRDCWELVELLEGDTGGKASGTGAANPTKRAIELLEGKTIQQWNSLALQDPAIKASADAMSSIIKGTFLPPLVETGVVTVDAAGIYHVVKQG